MRKLIKADGTEIEFPGKLTMNQIRERITAEFLDTVNLIDRVHVMIVDDLGHAKCLPLNQKATGLYWEKCGRPVDHVIRGDVIIVPDVDFESAP